MYLNTIMPAKGSHKIGKRVGRGIGCGKGKTCGRGHKGQDARAGARSTIGFEGGQMPFQRRVPKFGFVSQKSLYREEIRLSELNNIDVKEIDMDVLHEYGIIRYNTLQVKIFKSGKLTKAIHLRGIPATKGAKADIEALGGKVEE